MKNIGTITVYSNKSHRTRIKKKYGNTPIKFIPALICLVSIISIISIFSTNSYSYKEPTYVTMHVKSGDTLWDIAKERCGNKDIRKYIYDIKKINNMTNSNIYAGKEIKLPS